MCGQQLKPAGLFLVAVLLTGPLVSGCAVQKPTVARVQPCGTTSKRVSPNARSARPKLLFADRIDQGYTLVLPGIWGDQSIDHGIVNGLKDADLPSAVEIYDWTQGSNRLVHNLRDIKHSRKQAKKLAMHLVQYQTTHPGKPIHLIGYSGGAGLAVFVLEELPDDHRLKSVVLLAPTLAADYDLRPAMRHSASGIHNFYSPWDVPVLTLGCAVVGTTDGRHTLAGGAAGFVPPSQLKAHDKELYLTRLRQQAFDMEMLTEGHLGGHFGWTSRALVAKRIAPLLLASGEGPSEQPPARISTVSSLAKASAARKK